MGEIWRSNAKIGRRKTVLVSSVNNLFFKMFSGPGVDRRF